ncbi:MAG: hypothetical protein ACE5EA_08875 [Nitrospirota bacterium]
MKNYHPAPSLYREFKYTIYLDALSPPINLQEKKVAIILLSRWGKFPLPLLERVRGDFQKKIGIQNYVN